MQELKVFLHRVINEKLITATLSNPREKGGVTKVKVRPILKKGLLLFQCEAFQNKQVFHENLEAPEMIEHLLQYMEDMKQMQVETKEIRATVLISKKGKVTISEKRQQGCTKEVDLSHNKQKEYILKEGMQVPFLQDLGVMTEKARLCEANLTNLDRLTDF